MFKNLYDCGMPVTVITFSFEPLENGLVVTVETRLYLTWFTHPYRTWLSYLFLIPTSSSFSPVLSSIFSFFVASYDNLFLFLSIGLRLRSASLYVRSKSVFNCLRLSRPASFHLKL